MWEMFYYFQSFCRVFPAGRILVTNFISHQRPRRVSINMLGDIPERVVVVSESDVVSYAGYWECKSYAEVSAQVFCNVRICSDSLHYILHVSTQR